MVTELNPHNLTPDQKVGIHLNLLELVGEGILTQAQADMALHTILGIEMTPEEIEYERRNTAPADYKGDSLWQ